MIDSEIYSPKRNMNRIQLSYAMIVLCIAGCILLVFFLTFAGKKWTLVKTQIVLIIVGYIGMSLSWVIYFQYRNDLAAKNTANILAQIFYGILGVAYVNHSWTRAKSIMSFQNQFLLQMCTYFVRVCPLVFFFPTTIVCIATITNTSTMFFWAMLANNLAGTLAFHFDIYMLYKFITFFLDMKDQNNTKPKIVARNGAMAIFGAISSSLAYPLYIFLGDDGAGDSLSNVFFVFTVSLLFFIPLMFVKMKWELKEETDKNSKNSNSSPKKNKSPASGGLGGTS